MPAHPTFLSCVLRLQICDRNFRCSDTFAARAFRRVSGRGCVSQFFALRRLKVSAGDIEGGRCGHDDLCTYREHVALVRTSARRTGRAFAVGRLCQTPWHFTNGAGNWPTSSATETAVPGEFREVRRTGRCSVSLAKWKTDHRSLRRISRCASRKSVDERHTCSSLVCD